MRETDGSVLVVMDGELMKRMRYRGTIMLGDSQNLLAEQPISVCTG